MEGRATSQLPAAQLRAILRGTGHRTGNVEVGGEGRDSKCVAPCRTNAAHPLPFPLLALSCISKGPQRCH